MKKVFKRITDQLRITKQGIVLLNYCKSLKVKTAELGWLQQPNIANQLVW